MEKVKGTIKNIMWAGDTDYVVVNVKQANSSKTFVAIGNIPNCIKNADVTLIGEWFENKKRNNEIQFKIHDAYAEIDKEKAAAIKFLSTAGIFGVGDAIARNIVEQYGTDLDSIMTDEKKLSSVKKIRKNAITKMKASYLKNRCLYQIYKITGGEISFYQAGQIYKKYKDESEMVLKNNPYILIYD